MIFALSSTTHSRIAAFSSSSEKKRWLRNLASTNRSTICTATSTFALSRGLRTRVGSTTKP
jgi:hypothetical protein